MKKSDINTAFANNTETEFAIQDPFAYKHAGTKAARGKIVETWVGKDGKGEGNHVLVRMFEGGERTVMPNMLICEWSVHEARLPELAAAESSKAESSKAETNERKARASSLLDALEVVGVEGSVSADGRSVRLNLDNLEKLVGVLFDSESVQAA